MVAGMRFPVIVALSVAAVAALASTGEADDHGRLVRCGSEQVALFPDTTTKDGRFAVGWTIRKHGKPGPAPWSEYDPDDQALHARMALLVGDDGAPRDGEYKPVQGLVDLRAKQFTPLPSDQPEFVGRPRTNLLVRWEEAGGVARYGVIINDHDGNSWQFTNDLWLIDLASKRPRVVDLKPAADRAIGAFMKARDPEDHARYEWSCALDRMASPNHYDVFRGHALTLPFSAEIPDEPKNVDAGFVQFALPGGAVRSCTPDEASRKALRNP